MSVWFNLIISYCILGQQIIRLPDGRLQLLTMPQNQQASQQVTQASSSPQISIQKPTVIVSSSSSVTSSPATGSTPQLVITSNQPTLTSPSRVLIPSGQLQTSNVISTGTSGGVVIAKPMTVASAAAQVRPAVGQVSMVSPGQAVGVPRLALAGSTLKTITVARPQTTGVSIPKISGTPIVVSQGTVSSVAGASTLPNAASTGIRQVIMASQPTPIKVSPGTVLNASTAAALLQVRPT